METRSLRGSARERLDDVRARTLHESEVGVETAMREVVKEAEHLIDHTIKAFGNCETCFGKGYATTLQFASGRGESDLGEGHIEVNERLPLMRFCTCARGKQLHQLMKFGKLAG